MRDIKFKPIWFDSLGAKSMATLVETPDVKIVIDPGAAKMQPGFRAPEELKTEWKRKALQKIYEYAKEADIIIISHYHHDHYLYQEKYLNVYMNKILLVKNPNYFINKSQRERAIEFFRSISKFYGVQLQESASDLDIAIEDPTYKLKHALSMDFGDYNERRKSILKKGSQRFENLRKYWSKLHVLHELNAPELHIKFADGKAFRFGKTVVRFTEPLFHGVEYSTLGWVLSVVIERNREKLIHTSDLSGPVIEDYADWIISENPDVLIVDGPMTYMLGYVMSSTTLRRAVSNMVRIIESIESEVIIYDHHLLRDPLFKERTSDVWETAKRFGKVVLTTAEYLGIKPVVLD